jgi:putative cardiolipin synthase
MTMCTLSFAIPWRGLAVIAALQLAACASLPPATVLTRSEAITDVAQTRLARVGSAGAPDASSGLSGFRLLPEAAFAFDARIAISRSAEKSLDVQYYLIKDDDVGLRLLSELRDAARRGVRVRLLVDDLYTAGQDELFLALASQPHFEVRLFNPFPSRADSPAARLALSLHEFERVNHRMHNKLMVADGSLAVAGGRNLANEYFMRSDEANFIDIDVLATGPVVGAMSQAFDLYWNSAEVRPVEDVAGIVLSAEQGGRRLDELLGAAKGGGALRERDVLGHTSVTLQLAQGQLDQIWAPARLFVDEPAKIHRSKAAAFHGSVTESALDFLDKSHGNVTIISPYFIPGPNGIAMMRRETQKGGRITVITNSLGATDAPLVYAGYERHRVEMLKAGVDIYELASDIPARSTRFGSFGKSISRLHAKLALIDGTGVFIGSMNLDHRSADINTEIGLAIESPSLVAQFEQFVRGDREHLGYRLRLAPVGRHVQWLEESESGVTVVHDDAPGNHFGLRLRNRLLLPFVGEDLL